MNQHKYLLVGEEGSWSTPDTGKLVVEKDTGNALAINSGTVTVNYNIGYQLISTQVIFNSLIVWSVSLLLLSLVIETLG